jgi:hypothetical protein
MPELGEVRLSKDIGRNGHYYVKWSECQDCKKQYWKRTTKNNSSFTARQDAIRCKDCNVLSQKGYMHHLMEDKITDKDYIW